jgi:hypothetical protein
MTFNTEGRTFKSLLLGKHPLVAQNEHLPENMPVARP